MSGQNDPALGINSWLEDELYQQYLHDRKTVDDSWKHRFETEGGAINGNGAPAVARTSDDSTAVAVLDAPPAPPAAVEPTPLPEPGPGEQIVPLRGAAARIA